MATQKESKTVWELLVLMLSTLWERVIITGEIKDPQVRGKQLQIHQLFWQRSGKCD